MKNVKQRCVVFADDDRYLLTRPLLSTTNETVAKLNTRKRDINSNKSMPRNKSYAKILLFKMEEYVSIIRANGLVGSP